MEYLVYPIVYIIIPFIGGVVLSVITQYLLRNITKTIIFSVIIVSIINFSMTQQESARNLMDLIFLMGHRGVIGLLMIIICSFIGAYVGAGVTSHFVKVEEGPWQRLSIPKQGLFIGILIGFISSLWISFWRVDLIGTVLILGLFGYILGRLIISPISRVYKFLILVVILAVLFGITKTEFYLKFTGRNVGVCGVHTVEWENDKYSYYGEKCIKNECPENLSKIDVSVECRRGCMIENCFDRYLFYRDIDNKDFIYSKRYEFESVLSKWRKD